MSQNHSSVQSKKAYFIAAGALLAAITIFFSGLFVGNVTVKPETITQTEIKTETVTEYKTPQSCIEYIDYSNKGFALLDEKLGLSGEAMSAVSNYDYVELDILTKKINGINTEMKTLSPKLDAAKAICVASK